MKIKRRLCHHCNNYFWNIKTHLYYVSKAKDGAKGMFRDATNDSEKVDMLIGKVNEILDYLNSIMTMAEQALDKLDEKLPTYHHVTDKDEIIIDSLSQPKEGQDD